MLNYISDYFLNHQLFILIYSISGFISYEAILQGMRTRHFQNAAYSLSPKSLIIVKRILTAFTFIPYVNTVYALVFSISFLKGFLFKK